MPISARIVTRLSHKIPLVSDSTHEAPAAPPRTAGALGHHTAIDAALNVATCITHADDPISDALAL